MRDIIWACWALVGVVLIGGGLQAQFSGSRPQMQNLRTPLVWLVYGVIIGFVTQVVPRRVWTPLAVAGAGFRTAGVVLTLIGSLWIVWSRYTLGSQFTEAPIIGTNHHLITHGPYGITRHPIYSGVLCLMMGTMAFAGFGSWVPIFIATVGVLGIKLRAEERLLSQVYRDEYARYRALVPALIPRARCRHEVQP